MQPAFKRGLFFMVMECIEMNCPSCKSQRIDMRNHGRRTLGSLGGAAGAMGAATGSLTVIDMGMVGVRLGSSAGVPGAILGGLVGAMAGLVTGAKAGELIDELVLNNYLCLSCGHAFQAPGQKGAQGFPAQRFGPTPSGHEDHGLDED